MALDALHGGVGKFAEWYKGRKGPEGEPGSNVVPPEGPSRPDGSLAANLAAFPDLYEDVEIVPVEEINEGDN